MGLEMQYGGKTQATLATEAIVEEEGRYVYCVADAGEKVSLGEIGIEGQEVYVLKLQRGDLPAVTIFVDATTGDVVKSTSIVFLEGGIPVAIRYEDYRELHGVRMPLRIISDNERSGRVIAEYEAIEVNLDIDDEFFVLTAPES